MRNVNCDTCEKDISEKYYEICVLIFGDINDSVEDEEEGTYQFCSTKCMGIWMREKAKEDYGVYE